MHERLVNHVSLFKLCPAGGPNLLGKQAADTGLEGAGTRAGIAASKAPEPTHKGSLKRAAAMSAANTPPAKTVKSQLLRLPTAAAGMAAAHAVPANKRYQVRSDCPIFAELSLTAWAGLPYSCCLELLLITALPASHFVYCYQVQPAV